ncbi:MAG: P27 family phage terminase small subunit, partial [Gammaproteobacteria bacterium]|nr:P27 family phage terminase small subunit [Gammaproteobacteria bacterium]
KQCDSFVRKYGESYFVKDDYGKQIKTCQQFPEVGIINRLGVQLLRLEQEFGLTPAARTRIQVTVEPPKQTEGKARFFRVCG